MSAVCPICFDSIQDEEILAMPKCGHKMHITCALTAAQYDSRCPICRFRDERIIPRRDEEVNIFEQYQEMAAAQEARMRRFRRRRSAAISKDESLRKLRDRIKQVQRQFIESEKNLQRIWVAQQRQLWRENPQIHELKRIRRNYQRRLAFYERKLNGRLEILLGEATDIW